MVSLPLDFVSILPRLFTVCYSRDPSPCSVLLRYTTIPVSRFSRSSFICFPRSNSNWLTRNSVFPLVEAEEKILSRMTGFFVRDGKHSVADYNSSLMGVVVVAVVVVVVVYIFHNGITRERFELSS